KDRQRDPNLGYTRDLVPMLSELLPIAIPRGVKFILNAGGLNPMAAREVLLTALKKFGLKLKVGVVLGDAVHERLDELQAAGVSLAHMDTGEDIADTRAFSFCQRLPGGATACGGAGWRCAYRADGACCRCRALPGADDPRAELALG